MSKKKKRVHYVKLFRDPENVKKALEMINQGYSYGVIGKVLKCDRTSVMSFHQRSIKGIKFRHQPTLSKKHISFSYADLTKNSLELLKEAQNKVEKINPGKSYAEYIKEDVEKNKKNRSERVKIAKKNLQEAMKLKRQKEL